MDKEKLLGLAESGDIKAIEEVADSYYRGKNGFEEDNDKALFWYKRALELAPDNVVGLNGLGNIFYNGYGIPADREKGATYYLRAATLGYSKSQFNIASHLADEGDAKCIEWYEKAFQNGEYDAAKKLGKLYLAGRVVAQNIPKAIEWYAAGAEKGDLSCKLALAYQYISGKNIPKDAALGAKLMIEVAEQGEPAAMNNLSILYASGEGVEKNVEIGLNWAIKAAQAGDAGELIRYAVNYQDGDGFLPHDVEKAIHLFTIGAEAGDAHCMRIIAVKTWFGVDGWIQDREKGLYWAEEASKRGDIVSLDLLLEFEKQFHGDAAPQRYFEVVKAGADDGYYECMNRVYQCYSTGIGTQENKELALQYLHRAVRGGDDKALLLMGHEYMTGENIGTPDYEKGIRCFQRIIEQGKQDLTTAKAMKCLAVAYKDGTGVEQDLETAIEYLEAAAEAGDPDAMIRAGFAHNDDGWAIRDYAKSLYFFQKLADTDDPAGIWLVGFAYDNGKGVDIDKQKAFEYYQKAADKNYAPAVSALGYFYYNGSVVQKDLRKALECWEKAVELGHEETKKLLNQVYESEEFADLIDHDKVASDVQERAEAGDADAMYRYSEQLFDANRYNEAEEWERKAAEAGCAEAQFSIGFKSYLHEQFEEAMTWLEKAVAQDHAAAMSVMADMLLSGNSTVAKDEFKAFQYYKRSADLRNIRSIYKLGQCYYFGFGTSVDKQKAFECFEDARQSGCNEMWYELGECYWKGYGVQEDEGKALEMFRTGVEKQSCNYCRLRMGQIMADKGSLYYNPLVATQHLKEIVEIENFTADAACALGLMSAAEKDIATAIKWLGIASDAGSGSAQRALGVIFFNGDGVNKDLDKAEYYFSMAARSGYPGADKDAEDCRRLKERMQSQSASSQPYNNSHTSSGGGGCYVATAVYGSYDCPEVWTLRRFRDYTLAETWYGRAFIRTYYTISPVLVKWFGKTKWFKRLLKGKLDRMVECLQANGFESTPYHDRRF